MAVASSTRGLTCPWPHPSVATPAVVPLACGLTRLWPHPSMASPPQPWSISLRPHPSMASPSPPRAHLPMASLFNGLPVPWPHPPWSHLLLASPTCGIALPGQTHTCDRGVTSQLCPHSAPRRSWGPGPRHTLRNTSLATRPEGEAPPLTLPTCRLHGMCLQHTLEGSFVGFAPDPSHQTLPPKTHDSSR